MAKKKEINEKELKNKNDLLDLEQFYTTNKVDNMMDKVEEKKQEVCKEMVEFAKQHKKPCRWTKDGEPINWEVVANPLVINNLFFKPITSIGSVEPEYTPEKLSMVFDYYCYLITEVNDKIGKFPSSLTSFCKLAGITSSTLRKYKDSSDLNMRIIVNKIYDQIGDVNITMSQVGAVNERTTIFKMKSQNEIFEKEQPKIRINIVDKPDMAQISDRINKYKQFANKKGNN